MPGPDSRPVDLAGAPPPKGTILAGKYRVDGTLGVGGMGVVLEATHVHLREKVAIKLLHASRLAHAGALERFMREARAASRIRGEHVVRVHDVGILDDGTPYIAMECLRGLDLFAVLAKQGPLPVQEAADYVLQACEALAEAHALGIVHRDLKPANLFLTRRPDGSPCVKVLDFGVSKTSTAGTALTLEPPGQAEVTLDEAAVPARGPVAHHELRVREGTLTQSGAAVGSPRYMAPEQRASPHDVDGRADIWSLGAVLFELVTGRPAFQGDLRSVVEGAATASYTQAGDLVAGVPKELDAVLKRCLAVDRQERWGDVASFARALSPFASARGRGAVDRVVRIARAGGGQVEAGPASSLSAETVREGVGATPEDPTRRPHRLTIGDVLDDRYELLSELGRGGQGAVFRARDRKARVEVALKILFADTDSVKRYRRELIAARKITHPRVVRVYDLVEAGGHLALTMEFVDGENLGVRLRRKEPLSDSELAMLAADLAGALAAAHDAGVVHRDLKPANILLEQRTGHAKVADFGVSRIAAEAAALSRRGTELAPLSADPKTLEGSVVGTPTYMSPEQLAGIPDVGPAADVFAFGVVMFEAVTGRAGDRPSVTGDRGQLEVEAVLRGARPGLPEALGKIIARCLAIRPGARYSDGAALVRALDEAMSAPRGGRLVPGVALAGAVLLVTFAAIELTRKDAPAPAAPTASTETHAASAPPETEVTPTHIRRLTFGDGCEEFPSFAPDGKTLVYDSRGDAETLSTFDLATSRSQAISRAGPYAFAPALSPDGKRVAFLRVKDDAGLYVLDLASDAAPRKLGERASVRPRWSADGGSIWTGLHAHVARVNAETGAVEEVVPAPEGQSAVHVAELSGGRRALTTHQFRSFESEVSLVEGGSRRVVFEGPLNDLLLASADGERVFVSRITPTTEAELFSPATGDRGKLTVRGINARAGLARSLDGQHLVWSACREVPELARVQHGSLIPLELGPVSQLEGIAAIPGTSAVVVVSDRSGALEPWRVDTAARGEPTRLAEGAGDLLDVAVSPDGKRLAFVVREKGIRVKDIGSDAPLRVVTDGPNDQSPSFRRDSDEIVFTRFQDKNKPRVLVVSAEGGEPRPLGDVSGALAVASPTSDAVVYVTGDGDTTEVMLLSGGERRRLSPKLPRGSFRWLAFSPDGKKVLLVSASAELYEVSVQTGVAERLLAGGTFYLMRAAYVGPSVIVEGSRSMGNLWMADGAL